MGFEEAHPEAASTKRVAFIAIAKLGVEYWVVKCGRGWERRGLVEGLRLGYAGRHGCRSCRWLLLRAAGLHRVGWNGAALGWVKPGSLLTQGLEQEQRPCHLHRRLHHQPRQRPRQPHPRSQQPRYGGETAMSPLLYGRPLVCITRGFFAEAG